MSSESESVSESESEKKFCGSESEKNVFGSTTLCFSMKNVIVEQQFVEIYLNRYKNDGSTFNKMP
jgi:hypothetical protein